MSARTFYETLIVNPATGGKKWTQLKCGPQIEYGGMICDLTDRASNLSWILDRPLLDPDRLDESTSTVIPVNNAKGAPAPLVDALAARRRAMGYD